MKFKTAVIAIATSACLSPVYADSVLPITPTNTTNISANTTITPGSYVVTIAPSINMDMGSRLEKAVEQVPGVGSVSTKTEDSTIRFTVKNGTAVRIADLEAAVVKTQSGAVMSTPILVHSLSPNPGL